MNKALVKAQQNGDLKILPDNDRYTNRLEIKSASSNRLYIVAQNKANGQWSCSCPGWITRRKCKHLTTLHPLLAEVDKEPKSKTKQLPVGDMNIEVDFNLDMDEPKKSGKKRNLPHY